MTTHPVHEQSATSRTYLLFAHEPYLPPHGLREVNCTIVAADTLLHPHVRQPDGTRTHRVLVNGSRAEGEIVPLATLTHELDGGTGWHRVADWERVVADLFTLTRFGSCDSLSVGLPALERALICNGPNSQVINYNPDTGRREIHGPEQRSAVLATLRRQLSAAETEHPLWPGGGLLPHAWPAS
ncbi:hypothetical protein [Streptomyces sp. NPDC055060]